MIVVATASDFAMVVPQFAGGSASISVGAGLVTTVWSTSGFVTTGLSIVVRAGLVTCLLCGNFLEVVLDGPISLAWSFMVDKSKISSIFFGASLISAMVPFNAMASSLGNRL